MSADKFTQLFEMPVTGIHHVGNFDQRASFQHPEDRKLVSHPKLVQRIYDAFAKVGPDIELYFVNTPNARRYVELGQVTPEFVFSKPGEAGLGLTPQDVQILPDTITVFFTNNRGAERFPMTPWIIGHRFGHVLARYGSGQRNQLYDRFMDTVIKGVDDIRRCYREFNEYRWHDHYGQQPTVSVEASRKAVAHAIGTMRSARTRSLRNYYEFIHELFAQFLTTGTITFNSPPRSIPYRYAWGRPISAYLDSSLAEVAEGAKNKLLNTLPSQAEMVLGSAINSIYVM